MARTILIVAVLLSAPVDAFFPYPVKCKSPKLATSTKDTTRLGLSLLRAEKGDAETTASDESTSKPTLEEKMKSWEASEEEIKAATLGGMVPSGNKERTDAFDVGLYIAFPLMVLSGLAFALFPLIMGNIDVDSVGPPPTI